ncbi:MAG TPA: hypothetical protein VN802_12305 [Stellaceae bacterium]|nr:hypothetical protein [Stellaceae bacterium]
MNDEPAPIETRPQETAVELFRALVRVIGEGRVTLRLDFKRLQHIDCPVGSEADGNIWAYGVLAATILALWRGGLWAALAIAAVGVALYYSLGHAYMRRRIRRRVEEQALTSLDVWQRLWRFGGIALVPQGGQPCQAPQGNWMALVREVTAPAR